MQGLEIMDASEGTAMAFPMSIRVWAGSLCLALALAGCLTVGSEVATPEPGSSEHRIGTRDSAAGPEFFDIATGEAWIPRGPNLHRMAPEGEAVVDTMLAPETYEPDWVAEQLDEIVALGYNSVRTSFDICILRCIGAQSGGLDPEYLDNVSEFLGLAHDRGLQVFLTSNDLPDRGGFVPRVEATTSALFDGYINSHYLHPVGYGIYRDYWVSLVQALLDRGTPMDAVAGYQLRGEFWMSGDRPPLSLTSGSVTAANGSTYDLADPSERIALVNEGTRFWLNSIREAILDLDPTALVGVGVFAPNTPNVWHEDPRVIDMSAIWGSEL
ncbi:MAG: hypothetical protein Q8M65_00360, partial [Rhodoglobus sp.]|nr:hypothetical protein [Rhodoglobus sp.]